jgi:hypothetical protein
MRTGIAAPVYLSISWILTISYQLLTETAVTTVTNNIAYIWPSLSGWLTTNTETVVFIYSFTWIFVLSSVIPSMIAGKEKGFLVQYLIVLVLSLVAFFMPDILYAVAGIQLKEAATSITILQNPAVAIVYLAVPYLFMVAIDWHGKSKSDHRKKEELIKTNNRTTNRPFKIESETNQTPTETPTPPEVVPALQVEQPITQEDTPQKAPKKQKKTAAKKTKKPQKILPALPPTDEQTQ